MIFRTGLTASLETTNRLLALDLVKGFCIVLMVVAHSGSPEWLTSAIGLFHMPCFFVVSGFLFKESHLDSPGRYVRKRFRAFWWTFVFWTIVYVALHNLFYVCRFYEQSYTLRDSLAMVGRSLFMGGTEQLLGGFWFLSSLLFASLVAFVYYKWIGFGTRRILAGIIMLVACGELLLIAGVEVQTIHLNARDFFAAAYFMTGTLFARIEDGMRRKQTWTMTTAAVVLLAIQYGFHRCTISSLTPVNALPFYISSTIASCAIIQICHIPGHNRVTLALAKIGSRTLDVLIFHFLVFKLVAAVVVHVGRTYPAERLHEFPVYVFDNPWMWVVYTVVAVGVSVLVGDGIAALKNRYRFAKVIFP